MIFAFDADDSGFLPVMKFARGGCPDQQIILTEKSSKKVSKQKAASAHATRSQRTSEKHIIISGFGWSGSPEADIAVQCIEYQWSAP